MRSFSCSLERLAVWSLRAVALVVLVAALPTAAFATTVTYAFSGTITGVIDNIGSIPIVGGSSTFSGLFSYDTNAAVISNTANTTSYFGSSFSATIDDSIQFSDSPPVVSVTNDHLISADNLFLGSVGAVDVLDLPSADSVQVVFNLADSASGAFGSEDLPLLLQLSSFDSATFYIVASSNDAVDYRVSGTVDTLTAVPEASTGLLLMMGLVLTAAVRPRTG